MSELDKVALDFSRKFKEFEALPFKDRFLKSAKILTVPALCVVFALLILYLVSREYSVANILIIINVSIMLAIAVLIYFIFEITARPRSIIYSCYAYIIATFLYYNIAFLYRSNPEKYAWTTEPSAAFLAISLMFFSFMTILVLSSEEIRREIGIKTKKALTTPIIILCVAGAAVFFYAALGKGGALFASMLYAAEFSVMLLASIICLAIINGRISRALSFSAAFFMMFAVFRMFGLLLLFENSEISIPYIGLMGFADIFILLSNISLSIGIIGLLFFDVIRLNQNVSFMETEMSLLEDDLIASVKTIGNLIGNLEDGLVLLDENGIVAECNNSLSGILGLQERPKRGSRFGDGFSKAFRRDFEELYEKSFESGFPLLFSHFSEDESKVLEFKGSFIEAVGMRHMQLMIRDISSDVDLHRNRESAIRDERFLCDLSAGVSSTLKLEEILDLIAESVLKYLNVAGILIFLRDTITDTVEIAHGVGVSDELIEYIGIREIAEEIPGTAINAIIKGEVIVVDDPTTDSLTRYAIHLIEKYGYIQTVAAPLKTGESVHGAIQVIVDDGRDRLKERQIELLKHISDISAMALQNSILHHEISDNLNHVERALGKLEELDKMRSDFLSIASHELRSPLAWVTGYSSALGKYWNNLENEKIEECIAAIERGAQRLERVVDLLIDAVSAERDNIKPFRTRIGFEEIKSIILEEFDGIDGNIGFVVSQGYAYADKDKVLIVLKNLIENAIKFSGSDSEVIVSMERIELKGAAVFTVSDRGIGIPEQSVEEIFDMFKQVEEAKYHSNEGLGLGLYIVKLLVEAHSGTVEVVSSPGRGSMFRVEIPDG